MNIRIGVDTLTYHCRLEAGEVNLQTILEEVADLGFEFLQLNACDLRDNMPYKAKQVRKMADELRLELTLAGSCVGRIREGDSVEDGVERVREWLGLAVQLGSPFARVSSGFYRNELLHDPDAIASEQVYVTEVLKRVIEVMPRGPMVVLENHSDFTPDEYVGIIEAVTSDRVAVFLDLINPVSLLLDPLPVVERLAPLAVAGHVKDYRMSSNYIEDGLFRRGFEVQWCYPGEGVADMKRLVGALRLARSDQPYYLSVEGLDNRAGVADQARRLGESLTLLRELMAPVED